MGNAFTKNKAISVTVHSHAVLHTRVCEQQGHCSLGAAVMQGADALPQ